MTVFGIGVEDILILMAFFSILSVDVIVLDASGSIQYQF